MAKPQRQLIVDNIVTTLAAIATPSFRTDVNTVERVLRHYDDVGEEIRPWIGMLVGRERFQYQPGRIIRTTLPLTILGYVPKAVQSDRENSINDLQDDILVALNADQTRGGNAVMTTIRDDETDESIAEDPGDGVLSMLWEIVYFRTTSAS